MPTPSIQTLVTDAQQVLNLDSISAVRSVVAVALANANTGTPLNPNLTTQQLWNEFYQVVTKPKSDIESIIANQLMKFLFAPPAPGGVGADKQVIFNDGGVLAGDPQFLWNKTTNLLTVTGSATITGDLTVDTSTLKVDSVNNRVGIGTATPAVDLHIQAAGSASAEVRLASATRSYNIGSTGSGYGSANNLIIYDLTGAAERYRLDASGNHFWNNVGGVAGTAMTLNSTGLGVGVTPTVGKVQTNGAFVTTGAVGSLGTNPLGNALIADFSTTTRLIATGANTSTAGVFKFINASSNASVYLESMTLDASGNLLVGTTTNTDNFRTNIQFSGTSTNGLLVKNLASSGAPLLFQLIDSAQSLNNATPSAEYQDSTTQRWRLYKNGGLANYQANNVNLSDVRTKTDIKPLGSYWNKIKSLEVVTFKYKDQTHSDDNIGLIAQQVESVAPELVDADGFGNTPEDGVPLKTIYTTDLYHAAIKALQEAMARIEALEAKLA